jgi:hypothetical protein
MTVTVCAILLAAFRMRCYPPNIDNKPTQQMTFIEVMSLYILMLCHKPQVTVAHTSTVYSEL